MLSLKKSCKNRKVSLTVHCKYKYFDSTVQRAEDTRQKFYFCRLPFAVNVKLNHFFDSTSPSEFPIPSAVGVWIFSGTTRLLTTTPVIDLA